MTNQNEAETVSAIEAKPSDNRFNVKNKTQLARVALSILPSWKKVRVLTNKEDLRSQGHEVAICEQDLKGKLTLLMGAPDLSTAANFLSNAVKDGRIK